MVWGAGFCFMLAILRNMLSNAISKMRSAGNQEKFILSRMLEDLQDNREAVAARLEAAREALGLSKKEFAERAGLSMQVYGPFENATRDLSLQSAKKLCKTYRLSLDFLYFGNTADLPTRISSKL